MDKQEIIINGTTYTIVYKEQITAPNTRKYAHTKLYLQRGNGKMLYEANIRNDNTIKSVLRTGIKISDLSK